MSIKIAINGFGRIGRAAFKIVQEGRPSLEVVGINDLADPANLIYLLKHDSVYGRYSKEMRLEGDWLFFEDKKIKISHLADPKKLPWRKLGADVVLECTGRLTDPQEASGHLKAGAKAVVISANVKSEKVPHLIFGVNEKSFRPKKDSIVSNGSCTTNCAVPVLKVLDDTFKISRARLTTVHAVTATQSLVDGSKKNWREGRAAFSNIIPAETGASEAPTRALPHLAGRISGSAFRVPVIAGSVLEIIAQLEKKVSVKEINLAFKKAAEGSLKDILATSEEPLVSTDILATTFSAIVDLALTEALDPSWQRQESLVRVVAWYDNEWAYACRLIDLAEYIGQRI